MTLPAVLADGNLEPLPAFWIPESVSLILSEADLVADILCRGDLHSAEFGDLEPGCDNGACGQN